jgi:exonuclease III
MGYDIPDEIKYREKIVANLDLKQLGYALLFGLLAFFAYKLPIEGDGKLVLPAIFGVLGLAFIFFNFEERTLDVVSYYSGLRKAQYNDKTAQKFSTAILVRGKITREIPLVSEYEWVNRELDFFKGNFISCAVTPANHKPINVVSVYSPAWPVSENRLAGIDVTPVKLKFNPKVWATEIIWSALKNRISNDEQWIVGGDYNTSETFDKEWQDKNGIKFGLRSSGNKEILDRMYEIGFKECLREYSGEIVPTFKNARANRIFHQMDHLFVTNNLFPQLRRCDVGERSEIFDKNLSDHLPIIADFD